MVLCWQCITSQKHNPHIPFVMTVLLFHRLLSPISKQIQFFCLLRLRVEVFFLSFFLERMLPFQKPKRKKNGVSPAGKKAAIFEQSPISCRLEILNSIFHPGARSSSALPLLPRWGEQRGLDAVTERFLAAAVCMQGRLKEAYALLRLAKKHLSTRTKHLWSERRWRLAPGRLLGNPRQQNIPLSTFWKTCGHFSEQCVVEGVGWNIPHAVFDMK